MSHEAGVLCVFSPTDNTSVLTPIQLEVLHVGDEPQDHLPVLLFVLEPQVGHIITVTFEDLAAEVTGELGAERLLVPIRLGSTRV